LNSSNSLGALSLAGGVVAAGSPVLVEAGVTSVSPCALGAGAVSVAADVAAADSSIISSSINCVGDYVNGTLYDPATG